MREVAAVPIPAGGVELAGDLAVPDAAQGVVLFAHGSGSSRHSPRNRIVAQRLQRVPFATLLVDLLTAEEERVDEQTTELRFDIDLLADRLGDLVDWLGGQPLTGGLPVALFGASTGAAAALVAATRRPATVRAVVSRGGRPDLAATALSQVRAPTLLIVGGRDEHVLALNERAAAQLGSLHELHVITGATHLFSEPGTLEQVADQAANWFEQCLVVPEDQVTDGYPQDQGGADATH